MNYKLSIRSLKNLENVHFYLVAIVKRAILLTRQDFVVIEGVRSREQCMINYGKGRTVIELAAVGVPSRYAQPHLKKVTWLKNPFNSKHCLQEDGFSHAVDICPFPVDWSDLNKFYAIAQSMFDAERMLIAEGFLPQKILRWGGDWKRRDNPHFEIQL